MDVKSAIKQRQQNIQLEICMGESDQEQVKRDIGEKGKRRRMQLTQRAKLRSENQKSREKKPDGRFHKNEAQGEAQVRLRA